MRLFTALSLLFALALTACSNGVSTNGTTTTYKSKEGSISVNQGAGAVANLGAPIYPGATQNEDNGGTTGTVSVAASGHSITMGGFTTPDSFDKVYAWYKARMPKGSEQMKMSQGGNSVASFGTNTGKPNQVSVTIASSPDKKGTSIAITSGQ